MRAGKMCWNCGEIGTYKRTVQAETIQLSDGRLIAIPDCESWICEKCGDAVVTGAECTRQVNIIENEFPGYYTQPSVAKIGDPK